MTPDETWRQAVESAARVSREYGGCGYECNEAIAEKILALPAPDRSEGLEVQAAGYADRKPIPPLQCHGRTRFTGGWLLCKLDEGHDDVCQFEVLGRAALAATVQVTGVRVGDRDFPQFVHWRHSSVGSYRIDSAQSKVSAAEEGWNYGILAYEAMLKARIPDEDSLGELAGTWLDEFHRLSSMHFGGEGERIGNIFRVCAEDLLRALGARSEKGKL